MKRTLITTIICVFSLLACMFSLSSCFLRQENICQHEYDNVFDADCNLCYEEREVAFNVIGAELSASGDKIIVKYDGAPDEEFPNTQHCEHNNEHEKIAVVKEHYRDEQDNIVNGTYIYHCTACNGYMVKEDDAKNNHKEIGITVVETEATCLTPATKTYECEHCGINIEVIHEALGHKFGNEVHVEKGQNPCIDGALAFKVCDVCKGLSEDAIVAMAPTDEGFDGFHTVEVWTLTKTPTEDEPGLLTGICTVCGDEEITYTIPKVIYGGEDYVIEIENGSCAKNPATCILKIDGAENYKYKIGEDSAEASDKLVFTTEVSIKKHSVTINGEKVDIDFDKIYDPDMKNGDENVFTPEINTVLICKDGIVYSSFTCEECEGKFTVQVRKSHNYVYELNHTYEGGVYTYFLKGICQNDLCGDVVEYSHEDVAKMVSVITTSYPTCTSSGTETHTIALGEAFETEQDELSFDITLDILKHHFHEFSFVEYGTYNKDEIEELAPIFSKNDGFKDFKCGQVNPLNLPCDACRGIYNVSIEINHVPSEEFSEVLANCVDGGSKTHKCVECGEDILITTPANGHTVTEYTEVTLVDKETALYNVKGICSVCGEFTEETVLTYSKEKSTKSTCIETGYDVYLNEDGTEIKIALPLAEIHIFEGVVMNKELYVISEFKSVAESVDVISCIVPVAIDYTCDICGKSFEMNVVADHIYDSSKENNTYLPDSQRLARRCTADGCGYIELTSNVTETVVNPTCLNNGSITYTADGLEIVIISIEALGHEFGPFDLNNNDKNVTAIIPVYCTDGIIENGGNYLCESCGEMVRCDVYLTHNPAEDENITYVIAPTCTNDGKGVYKCPNCPEEFTGDESFIVDIPANGHDYEYAVEIAPTADNPGCAVGVCKIDGCDANSEVELPVVNAENYNDNNSNIVTVKCSTCTETGIDAYTFAFTVEEKEYIVSFEVVSPVYEYTAGETLTYTYVVNEEVSFIDPYGAGEMKVILDVSYTIFTCDDTDCHIFTILNKTFAYDGNTYLYNFENDTYDLVVVEEVI